jgi:hypothetical protein
MDHRLEKEKKNKKDKKTPWEHQEHTEQNGKVKRKWNSRRNPLKRKTEF